jgi:hypothetical protein
LEKIGLEAQFFCVTDPAGWDPIGGRSPVHLAAELHYAALARAIRSFASKLAAEAPFTGP